MPLSQIHSPMTYQSIHFIHNVNISLFLQAAVLFLSTIIWTILKYHPLKSKQKVWLHAIYCKMRSLCWLMTLYHIPTVVYYSLLNITYIKTMVVTDILKNMAGIVAALIVLGMMRILPIIVIKGNEVAESGYKHHSMAKLRLTLMTMERCIGASLSALFPQSHCLLPVSIVSTTLILILRPYCSKLRNTQSVVCQLTLVIC